MSIQIVAKRGGMVHALPGGQPLVAHSLADTLPAIKHAAILSYLAPEEQYNLYYTVAHHTGIDGSRLPSRTTATFAYQTILAWDIDSADTTKATEYAACVADLLGTSQDKLTTVASGNGVHIIAQLKHPIRSVKYFVENKLAYKETCIRIAERMASAGLPGKVDPTIFEPARVLRLPGTINKKQGKPDTRCELVYYTDAQLEFDLFSVSGLRQAGQENIPPAEVKRKYPAPDFQEMVKECRFVSEMLASPTEAKEFHVFDILSLLGNVAEEAEAEVAGVKLHPRQLGEVIFKAAVNSSSLARTEFEPKWDNAAKYGSRTCSTINEHWGKCETCPHWLKIPTPLALKSTEHIGSEALGYWVLNSKGNHSHPNYSDLAKLFAQEFSYVSLGKSERMLQFNGTHYEPLDALPTKAWIERKMVPSDPLRECHRAEFVAKVKVCGALSSQGEAALFDESIKGKLNCTNGILDIRTGTFQNHTAEVGFQNVLPYSYIEGLSSEVFFDWLAVVTQDRVELIDSLLDIMAYCLWPAFDDHLFVYLTGEGSNGKSTFINVLRAVLGADNVAAVNIQQLTRNRFAPASLEGKLANLSEESSGTDLDADQLNLLKNLSAGGEMMIERKGEQGYPYRNKAKLIFSANKVPRFHENSEAIKRRLVVIPFDHLIVNKDSNVERRLIEEAPAILSMLVRRIQANTLANDGKFIVSRDTAAHLEAQNIFLTAGNTVVEWAKEELDFGYHVSEEKFILPKEAYTRYRMWCGESGIDKPHNIIVFSRQVSTHILPKTKRPPVQKVGGMSVRVWRSAVFKSKEGVQ